MSLPFGIARLDTHLADSGLRVDALHEAAAMGMDWGDDAPVSLFLAGIAARNPGPVLWLVRRRDLFAPALSQAGLAPERLIHAEARDDAELLACMEDALRHRGLAAVVGDVRKASLTATRRLQLAAEGGTTLALLRRSPARTGEDPLAAPSAALTRWRIGPAPSAPLPVAGVGRARWQVELVRQRGGNPFELMVEACDETGRCALAAELVDRPDTARRANSRAAA
ncbi:protein ImuA [Sphingomonas sp.]|uniref:ImuA family protein n=1 Tax=Sphingomonas sp. TaxID=28214 RepID=UPI002C6092A4|nr:protein ImuA [Sphingomonas sp.]HTG38784.1 protein ImuA [Sphingomonas sp.]